jgi:Uma2 family endonuclease
MEDHVSTQPKVRITPQEYLALERKAEIKSEYFDGEMFAMSGATREHTKIVVNLITELNNQFADRPCEVYALDLRTKVSPTGLYTYPDIAAICGEPEFEDAHMDTLTNPQLIIEVLSDSTESYDRGRKFAHYRTIDSLLEYVLVSQTECRIGAAVNNASPVGRSRQELEGDRKPFAFLNTSFGKRSGQFSPDGRWVAYQSNESRRDEVYVRPFPGAAGQWQISTSGGSQARWRADGKELYYIDPDGKLMAAPIAVKGGTLEPGTPMALFQTRIFGGGASTGQQYDVARDGRFLINTVLDDAASPITLILNWKPPVVPGGLAGQGR